MPATTDMTVIQHADFILTGEGTCLDISFKQYHLEQTDLHACMALVKYLVRTVCFMLLC